MFNISLLEKLQVPGLILAAIVILLMFQLIRLLIKQRDEANLRLATELAENTKTLSRMTVILDLICQRVLR